MGASPDSGCFVFEYSGFIGFRIPGSHQAAISDDSAFP